MLVQLIYTSVATQPMGPADLVDLLQVARSRNDAQGITGGLVYADGRFVQVLEGRLADVEDVYVSIRSDLRHRNVTLLLHEAIPSREFPDWTMGFCAADAPPTTLHGFRDLFSLSSGPTSRARRLLLAGADDGMA